MSEESSTLIDRLSYNPKALELSTHIIPKEAIPKYAEVLILYNILLQLCEDNTITGVDVQEFARLDREQLEKALAKAVTPQEKAQIQNAINTLEAMKQIFMNLGIRNVNIEAYMQVQRLETMIDHILALNDSKDGAKLKTLLRRETYQRIEAPRDKPSLFNLFNSEKP